MNRLALFLIHVIIWCTVFSGCNKLSDYEEQRQLSPDSRVEAILIRQNAGATVSHAYKLYLVPKGESFESGHEVFIGDKMIGLNIQWSKSKTIDIQYKDGRVFHFTNFWSSKKVDNFKYNVRLNLKPVQ